MIQNKYLDDWIKDTAALCKPDSVYLCNGSDEEYDKMAKKLIDGGTFIKLNESIRPNSYYCRSDPSDVARVEGRTFICTKKRN